MQFLIYADTWYIKSHQGNEETNLFRGQQTSKFAVGSPAAVQGWSSFDGSNWKKAKPFKLELVSMYNKIIIVYPCYT